MNPAAIRLDRTRERIREACRRAGRDPEDVRLVAVSKTFPAERVRELVREGQTLFGENRVQEALEKIPAVSDLAVWHLIGSLQRNKARHVVGRFELIHSVDGDALARELDRRAEAAGIRQAILVQVNLSREPSKHGVAEGRLPALLDTVTGCEHLELRGLMTIPPPVEEPERSRRWFAGLARLAREAEQRHGLALPELSMGMTDDFEVAIEEGATLVRVGRAIFGDRPSPPAGVE